MLKGVNFCVPLCGVVDIEVNTTGRYVGRLTRESDGSIIWQYRWICVIYSPKLRRKTDAHRRTGGHDPEGS